MKFRLTAPNQPRSRKAALHLAVVLSKFMDTNKTRRENLMKSLNQAQDKMARLQRTVEELETQIHEAEAADNLNRETLEGLMTTWQLTNAEILEIKSASLRAELAALEKEGITRKVVEKTI